MWSANVLSCSLSLLIFCENYNFAPFKIVAYLWMFVNEKTIEIMRKAMFTALLSLAAVAAGAQTMYDGLTFSQNNYYGTARSIGMGNAMTAVGGDLGSIGINPADRKSVV